MKKKRKLKDSKSRVGEGGKRAMGERAKMGAIRREVKRRKKFCPW